MPRIVMKFGGTSVANLDRIREVARRVKGETDAGIGVFRCGSWSMPNQTSRYLE
jgi:aspartokinase